MLLAVCHTFGVMCRWLGVADAVLRGPEKGGKSAGILENVLTPAAAAHPWFGLLRARAARSAAAAHPRQPAVRSDPARRRRCRTGITAIAHETLGVGGPPGDALTMIEVARDRDGAMPRIFGVNHHPEIVNRPRQLTILRKRMERGEVTPEWYAERSPRSPQTSDEHGDRALHVTSHYTLLAPLRHYLHREARLRAEALGRPLDHRSRPRAAFSSARPPTSCRPTMEAEPRAPEAAVRL